jgi:hypothetical protein
LSLHRRQQHPSLQTANRGFASSLFTLGERKANVKWHFGIPFCFFRYSLSPRYVSIYFVNSAPQRSAAVTAAATLAIAGSCIALLAWGWFSYNLFRTVQAIHARAVSLKRWEILFVFATAILPPAFAILGLQTGAGLFRLSAWARKSALLWAAFSLALCMYLLVSNPYEILVIDSDHWSSDLALLKQFLAQAFLIALAPVSIWWLILFTRASVKAQFAPAQKESQPSE